MAAHSSIPAWRIPMDRGAWRATVHGVTKSDKNNPGRAQESNKETGINTVEQKMNVAAAAKSLQTCPTLCNLMDCM